MNVPISEGTASEATPSERAPSETPSSEPATFDTNGVLTRLAADMEGLAPQLRKAAEYVLENPNDVGVSSVREIAAAADVKPNTFVRMARSIGFDGFEAFRQPFREEIRQGRDSFPDRARWLQSLSRGGKLARLYSQMAASAIENIEVMYSATDAECLQAAADALVNARVCYILGVGIANPLARNFAYLAGMAMGNVRAIPRDGSLPVDGLLQADSRDVLLAMTFKPYRREVVEAVAAGLEQGMRVIAISDSPAAPILAHAEHRFVVPTDSPQFFTSTIALSALLETLIAFVVADAGQDAVTNIARFHERRKELGVYWTEEDTAP